MEQCKVEFRTVKLKTLKSDILQISSDSTISQQFEREIFTRESLEFMLSNDRFLQTMMLKCT